MVVSVHAGWDRPDVGVIDARSRLECAFAVLADYDVEFEKYDHEADFEALARVHDRNYLDALMKTAETGTESTHLDPELILDAGLMSAAACACAAVLGQTRAAQTQEIRLCLSRPGSHHAGANYALGGCIINNLAVSAADAIARGYARVAIIDFDAHHGNGSEDIFLAAPDVLTVSMHQHPFFPGSGEPGEHGVANSNFGLAAGAGHEEAVRVYEKMLAVVSDFAPDFILMEAGVDAHIQDLTTDLCFEDETFRIIGEMSARVAAAAPLVLELGGGYSEAAVDGGLRGLLTGLGVHPR
jgi:acetoin utilization deacetylase AcuC-like enzyme